MVAMLFSGQGAQKAGMGKELYDCYPQKAEILREILKCSKEELYTDGDGSLFLNPEYLQAYFNIGLYYRSISDYDMACYYFKIAEAKGRPNMEDYTKHCR